MLHLLINSQQDSWCNHDNTLTIITYGGSQTFFKVASIKLFPLDINFNSYSMANILYLKDVAAIPGVCIRLEVRNRRQLLSNTRIRNTRSLNSKMVSIILILQIMALITHPLPIIILLLHSKKRKILHIQGNWRGVQGTGTATIIILFHNPCFQKYHIQ